MLKIICLSIAFLLILLFLSSCQYFKNEEKPFEFSIPDQKESTGDLHEGPLIEVYFSDVYRNDPVLAEENNRSLDRILASKLDNADISLDCALHQIKNGIILSALLNACKRGVKIRIVTESDYYMEDSVQNLISHGIFVLKDSRNSGLMHNKYIIIDGKSVWTGSFNTTDRGAYYNNNNAVLIHSEEVAHNFSQNFHEMFFLHKFGSTRPETVNPVIKLSDETVVRTYFSPEDNVAEKIINLICEAETSIYFMAFSFTNNDIGSAVLKRFDEGLDIKGVFEGKQNNEKYSEFYKMKNAGIPVKEDHSKYNMHHKVMIIDKKIVITGSYNFSINAEKNNDENIVIIENPSLAKKYLEEFNKLYDEDFKGCSNLKEKFMKILQKNK